MQTTKVTCEPSAAISMCAAYDWLKKHAKNNEYGKTVLVLISGGNVDPSFYLDLWNKDYLKELPG